ncbi:MAG TPA: FMN-binding protein [Patescibacteria group bacterium]|nr:FMN-binding protein [Patescibacteria group bacterium]
MKRIILSLGVIGLFLIYSIHQQLENNQAVNRVKTSAEQESLNPQSLATPTPASATPPIDQAKAGYKDGTYTGSTQDVFYGNIQVQVTISGGQISDVQFLQYPNDRGTSVMINSQAMPVLKQEAITAQSADVNIVSGATDSSQGFRQSLADALAQAKL